MKPFLLVLSCLATLLPACASESVQEAAWHGAIYGALGTSVSSVVWGRNDVLGNAARGAAAEQDARNAEDQDRARRDRQRELEAQLREKIGPDNTEAVHLLVQCKHAEALAACRRSADSPNPKFRAAGVWLEAVSAQDQRDLAGTRALYPMLVQLDDELETEDQVEQTVLGLVTSLEDTREEFGLPRRCES